MIPFSPPRIDEKIIEEVVATLKSGWITTGPRTKLFEKKIEEYCAADRVLCLNSATAGLELMLRWFGIGVGDEVILPAYTYAATANVIIHCGATPVFVDINSSDFNISTEAIKNAITPNTKVIMPVDIGGLPCDYETIKQIVNEDSIIKQFTPKNEMQSKLGRILVLSDAAHSLGAWYNGKRTGHKDMADATVFSFHAVKNLTTAEGGAICINLPASFDNTEIYEELCIKSLHGQNKDALKKSSKGNWRYDIIEAGYKFNMTDIQAAIGLVELERYDTDMLPKRKFIFEAYLKAFSEKNWALLPITKSENKETSYHVFMLRIKNISEEKRDQIMQDIFSSDVSVNVHFVPIPMMSYYKKIGYSINNYPNSYNNYSCEISLPVYYDLSNTQIETVINTVIRSIEKNL